MLPPLTIHPLLLFRQRGRSKQEEAAVSQAGEMGLILVVREQEAQEAVPVWEQGQVQAHQEVEGRLGGRRRGLGR